VNNAFQGGALSPQFLRALGIVPDGRLSQLQLYFGEAFFAVIEVKGTP
jgi:hypothetical protein